MKKTDEPRYVCPEWKDGAVVALDPHGKGRRMARKVVTYGIKRQELSVRHFKELVAALAEGLEWRLSYKGTDIVRVYPVARKDLKGIYAGAQVMSDFQGIPYEGLSLKCVTRLGKRVYTGEEVEKYVTNAAMKREHVSPETVVQCPKCGTEFRVGKSLV